MPRLKLLAMDVPMNEAAPRAIEALTPPPPDVQRLLARYDSALPLYYDAHRLRGLQQARQRWGLLAHAGRPSS
jgi:hypothetical protein